MKELCTYEGVLVASDNDAASALAGLNVRVTKWTATEGFKPVGRMVRVTIEIIEENETFDELFGVPPEVIADERDELES